MSRYEAILRVVDSNPGSKGWVPVTGSDDHPYWYQFDGGEKGGEFRARREEKAVKFVVHLDARGDYQIGDTTFVDGGDQLTLDLSKSNSRRVVIRDANTKEMDGYYCVIVTRRRGLVTIACDPMIKNDPKRI
jgi:hypothetical protein